MNPTYGSGGDEAAAAAIGIGILLFALLVTAIIIAIAIVVCWLLYKNYKKVPPQFQTLSPGLVWLMLVPLANIVMPIIIGMQVPEAFKRYFDSIGDTSVGDAGKQVGLIWGIAALCTVIPLVNLIAALVALVALVMFLLKVIAMGRKIDEAGAVVSPY
jgi:hypothetical protein